MTVQKLVVRQSLVAGENFTGVSPAEGPKIDGIVYSYLNRKSGGRIKFTISALMRLERVLLRFQDAATWSIEVLHRQTKSTSESGDGTATLLADESTASSSSDSSSIRLNTEEILVSGDELIIKTSGATSQVFVEAIAMPI